MKTMLIIGMGGFIGSVLRYMTTQFIQLKYLTNFPYGTLAVNVAGCFIIGVLFGLSLSGKITSQWRMFLATGICGGFTTFSAFSQETVMLMREEQVFLALLYITSSVLIGLAATFMGIALARLV